MQGGFFSEGFQSPPQQPSGAHCCLLGGYVNVTVQWNALQSTCCTLLYWAVLARTLLHVVKSWIQPQLLGLPPSDYLIWALSWSKLSHAWFCFGSMWNNREYQLLCIRTSLFAGSLFLLLSLSHLHCKSASSERLEKAKAKWCPNVIRIAQHGPIKFRLATALKLFPYASYLPSTKSSWKDRFNQGEDLIFEWGQCI